MAHFVPHLRDMNTLADTFGEHPAHLRNSRPIRWDRAFVGRAREAAVAFMNMLLDHEPRKRAPKLQDAIRVGRILEAIVADLYVSAKADPERFLAYSRRRGDYPSAKATCRYRDRYSHPDITYTTVVRAMTFLEDTGLIESRKGSYNRGLLAARGYRSRIRALPALVNLLETRYDITTASIGHAKWMEPIRLKGIAERNETKQLIPYCDTPETDEMRRRIGRINDALASSSITLAEGPGGLEFSDTSIDEDDRPDTSDRTSVKLHRVFNDGRWDHGGRFYGGWWMGLPKADRHLLLIDGEETIELDFSALHARMCYDLEGIPLPPNVDPYAPEPLGLTGPGMRNLIKKGFNQLLNIGHNSTPRSTPEGAAELLPEGLSYSNFLEVIERAHPDISRWFRGHRGIELQRFDSDIAEEVMLALADQGIPCLPVHDSFIVPRSAEDALRAAMETAYRHILSDNGGAGATPAIKSILSSP